MWARKVVVNTLAPRQDNILELLFKHNLFLEFFGTDNWVLRSFSNGELQESRYFRILARFFIQI